MTRTPEAFGYTPLGWLLIFGSIAWLIAIFRSALRPDTAIREQPPRRETEISPGMGALALIAGFLFGIPAALILEPRIMPFLPMWLNDLGCQIVIALMAGLAVGSISVLAFYLAEGFISLAKFLFLRRFTRADSTTPKSGDQT